MKFTLLFTLLLYLSSSFGQAQFLESGNYPVYNFTTKMYNALDQNWCAVQDHRGIMYFGNNQGVLEYDGVNWILYPATDGAPAHSMAVDNSGRVFFGSVDLFGYLYPDSTGFMTAFLLSDLLNEQDRSFGEIWETHVTNKGIVFQSYHDIFIWESDSLTTIHSEDEIFESFYVNDELILCHTDAGLSYLNGNTIRPMETGELHASRSIVGMLPQLDDRILIVTDSIFYQLDFSEKGLENASIRRLKTQNEKLLSNLILNNAVRINDNRISLGTWGNGAFLIDSAFNILAVIQKETGIQDDVIQGQFLDENGNLWLQLSSGITRVEIDSDITHLDDSYGLEGIVSSVTRFNDRIYVTTNAGMYYMGKDYYDRTISKLSTPKFQQVEKFDEECWDMITFRDGEKEIMLVITNDNIYEVDKDNSRRKLMEAYAYTLLQSKIDLNRVYIGLESGLTSIYRKGEEWIVEAEFSEVDDMITSISEDEAGNLWLGTRGEWLYRIDFEHSPGQYISAFEIKSFNTDNGLSNGQFIISQFKGEPLVAAEKGFYSYDREEDIFYSDTTFGPPFTDENLFIHRQRVVWDSGIFVITYSDLAEIKYKIAYLYEDTLGTYTWYHEPFKRISQEQNNIIYEDGDQTVWFGGSEGLYKYRFNPSRDFGRDFSAFIRRIDVSAGRMLFGGTFSDENQVQSMVQSKSQIPVLPYNENSLVFTYGTEPGEDESFTRFSFFLEGSDRTWSDWSSKSYKEYTHLREKKYIFHVKSKNIYGNISKEATYEFTILAPWYRKFWAFILYILAAAGIVYMIVIMYTRRLRGIIRERTEEVVAQKEVIEEKNNDIMDSIMYAEKIQRAILPPEDDLEKLNLDGFILFLPRDIVSGDFYWLGKKDNKIITVAADCTGHGIPGAFMSMLGVAFLNNIVGAQGIVNAASILDELRAEVIAALKQKGQEGEQKDGMDLALHVIDFDKMVLEFSGANNPLIMIRDNELTQIKADRMPIGIHDRAAEPFINNIIDIKKGDVIYTFSDGYQDQFGGPKDKKFMIKRMKELLLEIHKEPMEDQKELLHKEFQNWIIPYDAEQVDDIIIIGIRI
jgi:serine phosphatase RsbU (regulator of sigma subunit)